jgi:hypothetical protein
MKRILLIKILLLFIAVGSYAQIPAISNVSVKNLYPKGTIIITGSGFSSNSAQLQVWFGQQKGSILSSTDFTIEVEVPAQATYGNIEVINLTSRRSVKSSFKFLPSFSGEEFNSTKFAAAVSNTAINELRDLCSCDLNNDGKPDMVATKFSAATDILILQNTSTGPGNISFSKISYPLNFSSDHVACGDVDQDGFQDLVITKGGSSNRNTVFVVRNTSTTGGSIALSLTPFALQLDVSHVAIRSAIQDLNDDGRPEIVVTNTTNNVLYIFQNDPTKPVGANPFLATPIKVLVNEVSNTYGLDVQDFDGDGKSDILVNPVASSNHYILRNRSSSTIEFAPAQKISLVGELRIVTSADMNNDGKLDLITSSTGTNKVLVLMNQSTSGTFTFSASPIQLSADNAPWGVSIADIDGDKDPDIIVANQLNASIDVFIHDGNFGSPAFAKHIIPTTRASRNVIAADMDGDGKAEINIASFVIGTYAIDVLRNMICHKPVILNEAPAYVCNNPVELQAIPGINVTFDWKRDGTSIQNTASPLLSVSSGGTYTVSISSVNPPGECTNVASESFTVIGSAGSVPENPTITLNTPLCTGATLNLSTPNVTAGASYKWVGPNWTTTTTSASTTIPNVTAAHAGEYTVQIIIGNCKSNISAGNIVDVVAVDNFAITSNSATNSSCEPNPVNLTVNSVSGFSYAWRRNTDPYPAPSGVNTFQAYLDGSYSVRVTNAALGCPAREIGPVKVAILKVPVADFSIGNPRCGNVPIQFTNLSVVDSDSEGTEPVAPVQWSWNFDNGTGSTEKNPSNTYSSSSSTYNVTLIVSYRGVAGCTNSKSLQLTITGTTLPVITPSAASICPGVKRLLSLWTAHTPL